MWKVFQRWVRVVDVFISRRLNNKNKRFAFVKFQDVVELERKLDSVWIGYKKVTVNKLKYNRDKEPRQGRYVETKQKISRDRELRKEGNAERNGIQAIHLEGKDVVCFCRGERI